jgi:serine phosphatase RsbU (regulator of sigma subunit)
MSAPAPNPSRKPPTLVFVEGTERRQFRLQKVPFTIGRRMDKDLVLSESRCSRDHALITLESDGYCLVDEGSKLGTFVNGQRVQRHRLAANDRVEFGVRGGSYLLFEPDSVAHTGGNEAGMFLSRMSGWVPTSSAGEFATLNLLLEAARKLNSSTVLEEVLVTLLEVSLRLTRAERGFVFLRDDDGKFRLAAGRSARGDPLLDDDTISHSSLEEAAASGCEFVVTEAGETDKLLGRRSVEDFGIASVICIPLWNRSVTGDGDPGQVPRKPQAVRGVLYLDSRSLSGRLTAVSHDILRTLATEAATLVENAALVQSREAARRYEQELAIAGSIQQRLLSVRIPEVPYAEVRARSVACQQIGGDFFDVVRTRDALAVVVGDVCGKGVSAALLASVLQGLIYSQLAKSAPLEEVAAVTHGFLCDKEIGEKYATLLLARLRPDGELEMVNCGHLPPLIVSPGKVSETEAANPPVGLVPTVFQGTRLQLRAGDRMVVVTDGVTEAENGAGEYFGGERLRASAPAGLDAVLTAVREFCAGVPLGDDCTALEMMYRG